MIILYVLQFDFVAITVGRIFTMRKFEIQDAYSIDILQMIVPFALRSLPP